MNLVPAVLRFTAGICCFVCTRFVVASARVLVYDVSMQYKIVTFRCPTPLAARLDKLAETVGRTRNALVIEMIRVFVQQVRRRRGRVLPCYTVADLRKGGCLPEWLGLSESGAEVSSKPQEQD